MANAKCFFLFEAPLVAGSTCEPHHHPCTELAYNLGCQGWLIQGSQRQPYAPETLSVYQPGTDHWIENQTPGLHFCVGVTGCGAETVPWGVYALTPGMQQALSELLHLLHDPRPASAPADPWNAARADLQAGLLVVELRASLEPGRAVTSPQPPSPPERLLEAKQVLDRHFEDEISIDDLSSQFFISPDYFRVLFKRHFGESPLSYLIQRRLDHACSLLETTDEKIATIARRCGMANPYYFSELFKKYHGQTPSQYRNQHQGHLETEAASLSAPAHSADDSAPALYTGSKEK